MIYLLCRHRSVFFVCPLPVAFSDVFRPQSVPGCFDAPWAHLRIAGEGRFTRLLFSFRMSELPFWLLNITTRTLIRSSAQSCLSSLVILGQPASRSFSDTPLQLGWQTLAKLHIAPSVYWVVWAGDIPGRQLQSAASKVICAILSMSAFWRYLKKYFVALFAYCDDEHAGHSRQK